MKAKGLNALGNVPLSHSETGAHRVFRRFNQSLDIKISKVDLPSKKQFPFVAFSDWLRFIVEKDQLEYLVGVKDISDMQKNLHTFWDRYKSVCPDHEIYHRASAHQLQLNMCIPVLHHGDEGRGLKKKQIMVLSVHGALGKGCRRSTSDDPLKLNLVGNTFLTHYLFCAMPIYLYNECPEAFYMMLDIQAEEFKNLFETGMVINNRRFFICCLGVKGDSPYISKAGMMERSFTRRPTRPSSKKAATGICHLCLAGKEDFEVDVPFEEYGVELPGWLPTVGLVKPWANPSPLLKIPFKHGVESAEFFHFDLFHNWHSGMGKYYIASAVIVCMELINLSIDGAFEFLSEDFMAYCRKKKESPYHKKLTKSLFGVEGSFKDCPDAAWSKGDFTRLLCQWFEDYCSREVVGKTLDPLYLKCVTYLYLSKLFLKVCGVFDFYFSVVTCEDLPNISCMHAACHVTCSLRLRLSPSSQSMPASPLCTMRVFSSNPKKLVLSQTMA